MTSLKFWNTTCTPTPISTTPASHSSTIAVIEFHLRHRLEAVWVARSNKQGSHSKSFECTAPHMPIFVWRCAKGKAKLKLKCWNYFWKVSWKHLKGRWSASSAKGWTKPIPVLSHKRCWERLPHSARGHHDNVLCSDVGLQIAQVAQSLIFVLTCFFWPPSFAATGYSKNRGTKGGWESEIR